MRKRIDFLDFRKIVEGKAPIPPELDADPDVGPVLREARTAGLSIGTLLQLFLTILPTILDLLNRDKS